MNKKKTGIIAALVGIGIFLGAREYAKSSLKKKYENHDPKVIEMMDKLDLTKDMIDYLGVSKYSPFRGLNPDKEKLIIYTASQVEYVGGGIWPYIKESTVQLYLGENETIKKIPLAYIAISSKKDSKSYKMIVSAKRSHSEGSVILLNHYDTGEYCGHEIPQFKKIKIEKGYPPIWYRGGFSGIYHGKEAKKFLKITGTEGGKFNDKEELNDIIKRALRIRKNMRFYTKSCKGW